MYNSQDDDDDAVATADVGGGRSGLVKQFNRACAREIVVAYGIITFGGSNDTEFPREAAPKRHALTERVPGFK